MITETHAPGAEIAGEVSCLLAVEEAAVRLGMPVRFVRRIVSQRRIRFYKLGRYLRFSADDLDQVIEAGRVDPGQPSGS